MSGDDPRKTIIARILAGSALLLLLIGGVLIFVDQTTVGTVLIGVGLADAVVALIFARSG